MDTLLSILLDIFTAMLFGRKKKHKKEEKIEGKKVKLSNIFLIIGLLLFILGGGGYAYDVMSREVYLSFRILAGIFFVAGIVIKEFKR